jgi:hypothetical protein
VIEDVALTVLVASVDPRAQAKQQHVEHLHNEATITHHHTLVLHHSIVSAAKSVV